MKKGKTNLNKDLRFSVGSFHVPSIFRKKLRGFALEFNSGVNVYFVLIFLSSDFLKK